VRGSRVYLFVQFLSQGWIRISADLRIDRINKLISNEFREIMIAMRNYGGNLIGIYYDRINDPYS